MLESTPKRSQHGAFVNVFFTVGGFKTVGIIFVHVLERFEASKALTAWMIGLLSFGLSLYAPVATAVGIRFSYRVSILIGGIAMSLGFFLTAFATNVYYVICVLGILGGIGNGFLYTPSMIQVGQYFSKHRSLAMGIAAAGGSFGQLVIPFLIRYLLDNYSFFGCMLIYSAIVMNCVAAAMLFRPLDFYKRKPKPKPKILKEPEVVLQTVTPTNSLNSLVFRTQIQDSLTSTPMTTLDDPPTNHKTAEVDYDDTLAVPELLSGRNSAHYSSTGSLCLVPELPGEEVDKEAEIQDLAPPPSRCCASLCAPFTALYDRETFRVKTFWLVVVAAMLGNAGYIDQFLFLPPYAKEIGIDKTRTALILSVSGIADLVGRVSGGLINNLKKLRTSYFVCLSLLGSVLVVGITLFFPRYSSLIAHGVGLGMLGGMYIALVPIVMVDVIGIKKFPAAFTCLMMAVGTFNLPLPTVFGKISDATGSYFIPFSLLNGMVLAASVLFMLIPVSQKLEEKRLAAVVKETDDGKQGKDQKV